MKTLHSLLISTVLIAQTTHAKDLGVRGPVFEIAEESLLQVIQRRLLEKQKDGSLEKLQTQMKEKVRHRVRNPKPVSGIVKTTEYKTWNYDPSITVSQDIQDHQGNIVAAKGTYNPLSDLSFGSPLLFIDGTDQDQVTWSLSQYRKDNGIKIILVKGSPFELMESHEDVTFYFDQMGKISEKFGLTHVPAIISQDGMVLKVEELPISIITQDIKND